MPREQDDEIRLDETTEIMRIKMTPSETVPVCYGGVYSGSSHVPGTAYKSLPRSASLPPLHRTDSKFVNQDVKQAFMQVFKGDFSLEWTENENRLVLFVICGDLGPFCGRLMRVRYLQSLDKTDGYFFLT